MPDLYLRTEAEQDELLLEIYSLSRGFALDMIRKQEVDDVVHEIAEDCLIKLRSNQWHHAPDDFALFVRVLVWNHLIDRRRKRQRRRKYDAEHLEGRSHTPSAWVSPDRSLDEHSIVSLRCEILEKLPYECRIAYYLVRQEDRSYAEVGAELGVARETVHNYISHAHRVFREELELRGITVTRTPRGGRRGRANWRENGTQLSPDFREAAGAIEINRRATLFSRRAVSFADEDWH